MHLKVVITALATAVFGVALGQNAQAAYVIDISQVGGNVVATGSGTFNFLDLSFTGFDLPLNVGLDPSTGYVGLGNEDAAGNPNTAADNYITVFGPSSFGSGGYAAASSTSGTVAGIDGSISEVIVPPGYPANGSTISSVTTWDNATIASLGLNPGTYVWTWGDNNPDSLTLNISSGIPEPSTWAMMLLGLASLGVGYRASRKSAALAA